MKWLKLLHIFHFAKISKIVKIRNLSNLPFFLSQGTENSSSEKESLSFPKKKKLLNFFPSFFEEKETLF